MKHRLGDEYPAAVIYDGVRLELTSESRWRRRYQDAQKTIGWSVSRFDDGSATITFSEVARDWPSWSEKERGDFCSECQWLKGQEDLPEMLRYIMEHGNSDHWSVIALTVAYCLPKEEAFSRLFKVLRSDGPQYSSNIYQGIALTKHPEAEPLLRARLMALWAHSQLWENEKRINRVAFSAMCSIKHLIELGVPLQEFEEQVRALSRHACIKNREFCRNHLAKYFPWLRDSSGEPADRAGLTAVSSPPTRLP